MPAEKNTTLEDAHSWRHIYSEYVISEDLDILFPRWAQARQLNLPRNFNEVLAFMRLELRLALSLEGHSMIFVPSAPIQHGMQLLADECWLPVVSMDPVYMPRPLMLHVTRVISHYVDESVGWATFKSSDRLRPRVTPRYDDSGNLIDFMPAPSISDQMAHIASVLRASAQNKIAIVDDVVFSGECVADVITRFKAHGIETKQVIAGILANEEGARPATELCEDLGVRLDAVQIFPSSAGRLVDEICERDFLIGAPMCGRTVYPNVEGVDAGYPYVFPLGEMRTWAAIRKQELEVSRALFRMNIKFWTTIGEANGRHIKISELGRVPLQGPQMKLGKNGELSFQAHNGPIAHHAVKSEFLVDHLVAYLADLEKIETLPR